MDNPIADLPPDFSQRDYQWLAWKQGTLTWKLRNVQQRMHRDIRRSSARKYVINSARRLGKSYLMCLMAIEDAIRIKNGQIRFAAPTQKALKKIVLPIIRDICRDSPVDVRPRYYTQDAVFWFPSSNSELHISGSNGGHCEALRGTGADRCYVDEAGYIDDLKYLVEDILMPQLLPTDGSMVISSTPPPEPSHPFAEYASEARIHEAYSLYTIHEAGYAPDIVDSFCSEAGGRDSTTWMREYLCRFVVDSMYALCPEWKDEYVQDAPRDEYFQFYHRYAAMDIGVVDQTAVLFGYYDFKRATLFIEDEVIMQGPTMTTNILAEQIKAKEKQLYPDGRMTTRIADNNNLLLLQDLGSMHKMDFAPTNKDTLEAMVNHLRVFVINGRLRVSSKCKMLIGCLKNGVWNERRTEFRQSSLFGHFDALAALIYLIRNLNEQFNPIPSNYKIDPTTHYVPDDLNLIKNKAVDSMLGIRRLHHGR